MIYLKFEDIPVWQESRNIVKRIYGLIKDQHKLQRDFALSDQFKRAGCSIMLNIAEGFERSSNTEFAHFLNIAKGSAGEVRAILYIIEDNGYIPPKELLPIKTEVESISTHIANFRKFLMKNGSRKK
jgi:four helix bundle protein